MTQLTFAQHGDTLRIPTIKLFNPFLHCVVMQPPWKVVLPKHFLSGFVPGFLGNFWFFQYSLYFEFLFFKRTFTVKNNLLLLRVLVKVQQGTSIAIQNILGFGRGLKLLIISPPFVLFCSHIETYRRIVYSSSFGSIPFQPTWHSSDCS